MVNSFDFLRDVASFSDKVNTLPKNKLARIDPDFSLADFPGTLPRVIFDGETTVTRKRYYVLSPYVPEPGDRVLMLPVSSGYIIAGCVEPKPALGGLRAETDYVSTKQSTTSTSFTNLTTFGPSVSITTGSKVLVSICAMLSSTGTGVNAYASIEVSGATSISPGFDRVIAYDNQGGVNQDDPIGTSFTGVYENLTPGVNTFSMKYRASGGSGYFEHRRISVVPL